MLDPSRKRPTNQADTRANQRVGSFIQSEGDEHRVKAWGGRPPASAPGGLDCPLPDRLGIAGRHAETVAGEGFAQRRPGGAQLGGGRIHAAELFGEGQGTLGLGPIREEPAGLPARPPLEHARPYWSPAMVRPAFGVG